MNDVRRPTVSGQFYPGSESDLKREIERCFSDVERESEEVIGAVVPHAGYIYSGNAAAHVYSKLPKTDTFVIIGLNHRGVGSPVAVSSDTWSTPLGEVEVDLEFVKALPKRIIDTDELAHKYEHSIEVQLPFLQYKFENFKIVPICMGLQDETTAKEVGAEVAETITKLQRNAIVLASSDFSHYVPDKVAREIDSYVIEPLLKLDVSEFYRRIYTRDASVCGYGAIATMLHAARMLNAKKGKLVKYATSGDVAKDVTSVVGYAGIIVI
ncbi:MAG: MEMO1 family protein [Halobacteriota archaeon]|nr:MEMO1 family protein [Halobacteriota archaeon]